MKIALACPGVGLIHRGYERATLELARELRDHASITVLGGGGAWWGGPWVRLPCLPRESGLARRVATNAEGAYTLEQRTFALGLYGALRALDSDVVHLHDPQVMNVLWHLRRRLGGRFRILFTNGGWLSPEHLHRADMVHCLTPVDERRMLDAGHPRERVWSVPYGIHLPPVPPDSGRMPGRALLVGALGRGKGVDVAVDAVARAPGWTLACLGARERETSELEAHARAVLGDRFSMTTVPPEQVPPEMARADAFLLPTRSEGFGMAVLEAMAHGLPCLLSDLEVLRWMADGAALHLPHDAGAWAEALRSMDDRKKRSMGEKARTRAAAFAWPALVEQYVSMAARAASLPIRS